MMTVATIVERVRAAIDELMVNDSHFLRESEDEQNLTNIIKDKIGYALTWIIEHAPLEKLDSDSITGVGAYTDFTIDADTLMGQAKLPNDVLRIAVARLSSWKYSPMPVTEHSDVYLMQDDEYARGSWDRPVSVVVHRTTASGPSERWIELYSAKNTTDTLTMMVFKKPDLTNVETSGVSVPSALEGAFVYEIAGLTMTAFNEGIATALFAIAERYLSEQEQ